MTSLDMWLGDGDELDTMEVVQVDMPSRWDVTVVQQAMIQLERSLGPRPLRSAKRLRSATSARIGNDLKRARSK